ncbi:MAG: hypothetical protein QME06_07740 [Desulfobacterales bacterium]|nr:hypothetical protein [Desulfobacterales bacterium]
MKYQELSRFQVASIVFSIVNARDEQDSPLKDTYQDFISTTPPEIIISVSYGGLPQTVFRDSNLIFNSGGAWSLYRIDGQDAIVLGATPPGAVPYKIALFHKDKKQITLYSKEERPSSGLFPNPLEYPLSEVLMICLLALGRGLMVHACGIDDDGRGYLFAGNSTHGKSTMAQIWKDQALVLNDDRIVLRHRDGRFWMYGTPWHGDYTSVSPQGVPLHKIFFLHHGEKNSAVPRRSAEAVSILLTRAFPPLWDKKGMDYTLGLLDRMASKLPCFELDFLPDKRIIDFVRNV